MSLSRKRGIRNNIFIKNKTKTTNNNLLKVDILDNNNNNKVVFFTNNNNFINMLVFIVCIIGRIVCKLAFFKVACFVRYINIGDFKKFEHKFSRICRSLRLKYVIQI